MFNHQYWTLRKKVPGFVIPGDILALQDICILEITEGQAFIWPVEPVRNVIDESHQDPEGYALDGEYQDAGAPFANLLDFLLLRGYSEEDLEIIYLGIHPHIAGAREEWARHSSEN